MKTTKLKITGRLAAASVISMGLLLTGCDRTDPLGNSVITAHGNTDWHIDTAEEFLYGTEMDGDASAPNHVPDTWIKRHMHVGDSNMAMFYHDESATASGDDSDSTDGIDRAMLFFYAGHGAPTLWNALGTNGTQSSMLLANYSEENPGTLRYYWQCSCDVFAHGPSTCAAGTGTDFTYGCPEQFVSGSADTSSMRNVFERWGPALGENLRMACGASTSAYCHESETNRIWDNYNNKSYDVADSFIYGLHTSTGSRANVIPLCITRGGFSAASTPLYDQAFTPKKNPVGDEGYLHIQYLSNFRNNIPWVAFPIPQLLPIFKLKPMPIPVRYRDIKFEQLEELLLAPEEIDTRGARVRIHTASGAISVLDTLKPEPTTDPLSEEEYVKAAQTWLREQGLSETSVMEPSGSSMKFQSMGEKGEIQESQKNVKVRFKRNIPIDNTENGIPVLGEGGVVEVQMNNDGSVFAATKVWREIEAIVDRVPVKSNEQALEEAFKQIAEVAQYYELREWRFGYKSESGNVAQEILAPVYEFDFDPINDKLKLDYPPQTLEIAGIERN